MLRVSQAVAPSARVLLTGDGGDDVFLGYEGHRHFWMAGSIAQRLPDWAAGLWRGARNAVPAVGALRRGVSFLDYSTGGLGAVAAAREGLHLFRRSGMLGERLRNAVLQQHQIPWSIDSARELLPQFLEYDRVTRFTGEYLPKVDGATMFHSVEARSPFLDSQLWEFAARLPFDLRLHRGQLKAILRAIARRHLGERVAGGRKRGFGIPVQRWMIGRWRDAVTAAFNDSLLDREGWLSAESLVKQLNSAARRGIAPNQLWYAYVLESWLRRERNLPAPLSLTAHMRPRELAVSC
jgi:asparagine synthase (glutamine-hydrolysing)